MNHSDNWQAMTLEEYRRLNPRRPITDRAIGGTTQAKRDIDALESRAHQSPDIDEVDRTLTLQQMIADRRRRGFLDGLFRRRVPIRLR